MSTSKTINHAEILDVTIELGSNLYNVRGSMLEINLFESLNLASVSGDITFIDSHRLFEFLVGGENVIIKFILCDITYTLPMICYSVKGKIIDERGGAISMSLVQPHFFNNYTQSAAGMYDDNCAIIMAKILNNLSVGVRIAEQGTKQTKQLSIPHMRPLEAVEIIRKESSSPNGNKMFVYGSLREGVVIDSLDKMLERESMDGLFRYGVAEYPKDPDDINQALDVLSRSIAEVRITDNLNIMTMAKDGFFGIRNNTIDMFNKKFTTKDYGVGSGLVDQGAGPHVNATINSSVSSLGGELGADMYSRSKSLAAVSLEGLLVSPYKFRSLNTIGHSINVVFPSNTHSENDESPFDAKRSGEYIITHSHLSISPGSAHFIFNAVSKARKNV